MGKGIVDLVKPTRREKDPTRHFRESRERWRRTPYRAPNRFWGKRFSPQREIPAHRPGYRRYQPHPRIVNPLSLSSDLLRFDAEGFYWHVLQVDNQDHLQEMEPALQRLKPVYESMPSQTREKESPTIGFFSFLSSLLKSSGSARSSPRLSKRLQELMEKNQKQYRTFFANSLEKIKALLWSYLEQTKHTERVIERELTESIVAERIARQRQEERTMRKRLEKKKERLLRRILKFIAELFNRLPHILPA